MALWLVNVSQISKIINDEKLFGPMIAVTLDIQLADAFVPLHDRSVFSCPSLGNPVLALVSQYAYRYRLTWKLQRLQSA